MTHPCFAPSTATLSTTIFLGASPVSATTPRHRLSPRVPRAKLDLVPGVPPGEDARNNAPLRYYVPRPVETYENRGFATVLPKTWEGETDTIGSPDVPALSEAERKGEIQVDAAATGAFVDFAQMVRQDRAKELEELKRRNAVEKTGRPTCGEEEGREFVSNYKKVLVDGVRCVEYWGKPNGPVPRLFGGPTA